MQNILATLFSWWEESSSPGCLGDRHIIFTIFISKGRIESYDIMIVLCVLNVIKLRFLNFLFDQEMSAVFYTLRYTV